MRPDKQKDSILNKASGSTAVNFGEALPSLALNSFNLWNKQSSEAILNFSSSSGFMSLWSTVLQHTFWDKGDYQP